MGKGKIGKVKVEKGKSGNNEFLKNGRARRKNGGEKEKREREEERKEWEKEKRGEKEIEIGKEK